MSVVWDEPVKFCFHWMADAALALDGSPQTRWHLCCIAPTIHAWCGLYCPGVSASSFGVASHVARVALEALVVGPQFVERRQPVCLDMHRLGNSIPCSSGISHCLL